METVKLKVVTYNIRYDNKHDGINQFSGSREHFVKKWLSGFDADLFGFQEVLPHVKEWLVQNLPDYTVLGAGRNADYGGETACIAYKKSLFDLYSFETVWLSDTPLVPGSRFTADQSARPRVCSIAGLIHKQSGKLFRFLNTHLDHEGELARVCGASLILQKIDSGKATGSGKFILVGDFNAYPDSATLKTFLSYENGSVTDATEHIANTFHDYGRQPQYPRIDYILTNAKTDSEKTQIIIDQTDDGIYLSDHYPVCAYVVL